MNQQELSEVFEEVFENVRAMRQAGQLEYARNPDNPFGNFKRVSSYINVSKEAVLMVYLLKHIDGILSAVNGHKSQREHVSGRIFDAITYLIILYAMIKENESDNAELP